MPSVEGPYENCSLQLQSERPGDASRLRSPQPVTGFEHRFLPFVLSPVSVSLHVFIEHLWFGV